MRTLLTALVAVFLCLPAHAQVGADESWLQNSRTECVYTTLDESGPGSLRDCIAADTDVVPSPELTGEIDLAGNWLTITDENVTISGLSEAGPISIIGAPVQIKRRNVMVSDMGFPYPGETPHSGIIIVGSDSCARVVENVILRRVSAYNAIDKNISMWGKNGCTHNITLDQSIVGWGRRNAGHPEGQHSKNILIGEDITGVLVKDSLIASSQERNPVVHVGASAAIVNNVIYNPEWYGIHIYGFGSSASQADVAGNVTIAGPDTPDRLRLGQGGSNEVSPGSTLYLDDNPVIGNVAWGNVKDVTNLSKVGAPHFSIDPLPSELTLEHVAKVAGPTFKTERDYRAIWCAVTASMDNECAIQDDVWPVAPTVEEEPPVALSGLEFDGTGEYVENTGSLVSGYPVTMFARVWIDAAPTNFGFAVTTANSADAFSDRARLEINSSGNVAVVHAGSTTGAAVPTGEWVWISTTITASSRKVFLNGGSKASDTHSGSLSPDVTSIGRLGDSTPSYSNKILVAEAGIVFVDMSDGDHATFFSDPSKSAAETQPTGYASGHLWVLDAESNITDVWNSAVMTYAGGSLTTKGPGAFLLDSRKLALQGFIGR